MENFYVYVSLVLSGLCLGSFAGASMWRLRARQLTDDKLAGERVDTDEYNHLKKLTKTSLFNDRSKCLHCSYVLRWYDLIPFFSWVSLRNKCRKCRKKIGFFEPLIELGMMTFFVLSYMFWPYPIVSSLEIARFLIWLISGVGLAILFAFDAKWFILPDRISFCVIGLGSLSALLVVLGAQDRLGALLSICGALLVLSGLYWVLYKISHGKWIGFGDIKLGLGLALLLADWRLAFIALFAANLIGCFIVLPAMITGKLKRNSHVPFGPLLIVGFVIAGLVGKYLVDIYVSLLI